MVTALMLTGVLCACGSENLTLQENVESSIEMNMGESTVISEAESIETYEKMEESVENTSNSDENTEADVKEKEEKVIEDNASSEEKVNRLIENILTAGSMNDMDRDSGEELYGERYICK